MARRATLKLKKRDVRLKDIPLYYKGLIENKVTIGVHKREGREVGSGELPNKANALEKAFWNEFGTTHVVKRDFRKKSKTDGKFITLKAGTIIRIPARPFIRLYLYSDRVKRVFTEYKNSFNRAFMNGLKQPKTNAKETLKDVAYRGEIVMKEGIVGQNDLQPNAPLTVYLKGFDYPLFETGAMLNAIRGQVEKS